MIYYLINYCRDITRPGPRHYGQSVMEGSRENFERLMSGNYFPSWQTVDNVIELSLKREPEGSSSVEYFWVATFYQDNEQTQPGMTFPDPLTEADLELIKTTMMREPKTLRLERYPSTPWLSLESLKDKR